VRGFGFDSSELLNQNFKAEEDRLEPERAQLLALMSPSLILKGYPSPQLDAAEGGSTALGPAMQTASRKAWRYQTKPFVTPGAHRYVWRCPPGCTPWTVPVRS
jgi:hypothetical protein